MKKCDSVSVNGSYGINHHRKITEEGYDWLTNKRIEDFTVESDMTVVEGVGWLHKDNEVDTLYATQLNACGEDGTVQRGMFPIFVKRT